MSVPDGLNTVSMMYANEHLFSQPRALLLIESTIGNRGAGFIPTWLVCLQPARYQSLSVPADLVTGVMIDQKGVRDEGACKGVQPWFQVVRCYIDSSQTGCSYGNDVGQLPEKGCCPIVSYLCSLLPLELRSICLSCMSASPACISAHSAHRSTLLRTCSRPSSLSSVQTRAPCLRLCASHETEVDSPYHSDGTSKDESLIDWHPDEADQAYCRPELVSVLHHWP